MWRNGPNVSPRVTSVSRPAPPNAIRSTPRRERPPGGAGSAAACCSGAGPEIARRARVAFAPMCTMSAPMVIHAAHQWATGKKNCQGYQWKMFWVPDTSRKMAPLINGRRLARSRRSTASLKGGQRNSLG